MGFSIEKQVNLYGGQTIYFRERGPGSIPGVRTSKKPSDFPKMTRARLEPGALRSAAGALPTAPASKSGWSPCDTEVTLHKVGVGALLVGEPIL